MKTCDTCDKWNPEATGSEGTGICESHKVGLTPGSDVVPDKATGNEFSRTKTGAKFGCVHHQDNEAEKDNEELRELVPTGPDGNVDLLTVGVALLIMDEGYSPEVAIKDAKHSKEYKLAKRLESVQGECSDPVEVVAEAFRMARDHKNMPGYMALFQAFKNDKWYQSVERHGSERAALDHEIYGEEGPPPEPYFENEASSFWKRLGNDLLGRNG